MKEAVRYLGYKRSLLSKDHAIDEQTLELIHSSMEELKKISEVRFVYRIFEISFANENELTLGKMEIQSEKLYKNLQGCEKAAVFGITLGAEVDRLLKKYSIMDMSKAVVLQACAAALLEAYCDLGEVQIKADLCGDIRCDDVANQEPNQQEDGKLSFRPRFSPGYGDFSIEYQGALLQMIDATRRIGVSLTEQSMMMPTKTVTAVLGISKQDLGCEKVGCENCEKKDCEYR